MTTPSTRTDSRELPSLAFTIRTHVDQTAVPLLLLIRYMSTIWASEIVTTNFTTQSMHHTCVSYNKRLQA